MTRATLTAVIALLYCTAAATPSPVTFESPCECRGNHGKARLAVKENPSTPPADANTIQALTPSDILSWPGLSGQLTRQSGRIAIENNWFAVTGRVVAVMAETDGDLHIELRDATGDKPGIVVVEVPAKPQWCEIRKTVFGWSQTRFPFHTSSGRKLNIANPPVITVVGKAFFDTDRALQKQFNRRKRQPYHAAWEIHPVMKLTVQ
jgi:hypothetical protein